MTTQDFAVEHARQKDVVGKLRLTCALCTGIDIAKRLADHVQRVCVVFTIAHQSNQPQKGAKSTKGISGNHPDTGTWTPASFSCVLCLLCLFVASLLFEAINTLPRQFHRLTAQARRR